MNLQLQRFVERVTRDREDAKRGAISLLERLRARIDIAIGTIERGQPVMSLQISDLYVFTEAVPRWNNALAFMAYAVPMPEDEA